MTTRRSLLALAATAALLTAGLTGYAVAGGSAPPPGTGTLTNGVSFFGPYSGADASTAGHGSFASGESVTKVTIRLPAYTIPNAGGGQDENHALALIEGHHPGLWITSAEVRPGISDYNRPNGKLVVWLNKPAPEPISFAYWTFGLFQD
jgi:hypothetical protein